MCAAEGLCSYQLYSLHPSSAGRCTLRRQQEEDTADNSAAAYRVSLWDYSTKSAEINSRGKETLPAQTTGNNLIHRKRGKAMTDRQSGMGFCCGCWYFLVSPRSSKIIIIIQNARSRRRRRSKAAWIFIYMLLLDFLLYWTDSVQAILYRSSVLMTPSFFRAFSSPPTPLR